MGLGMNMPSRLFLAAVGDPITETIDNPLGFTAEWVVLKGTKIGFTKTTFDALVAEDEGIKIVDE